MIKLFWRVVFHIAAWVSAIAFNESDEYYHEDGSSFSLPLKDFFDKVGWKAQDIRFYARARAGYPEPQPVDPDTTGGFLVPAEFTDELLKTFAENMVIHGGSWLPQRRELNNLAQMVFAEDDATLTPEQYERIRARVFGEVVSQESQDLRDAFRMESDHSMDAERYIITHSGWLKPSFDGVPKLKGYSTWEPAHPNNNIGGGIIYEYLPDPSTDDEDTEPLTPPNI